MGRDVPAVTLDEYTMHVCHQIACLRNEYEKRHGHMVKNPSIQGDPDKSYRTHLVGTMAEAAVCLYYEEPLELTHREDGRGGRSSDIILKGYTVEVKGTERQGTSRLIVPKSRIRESDVYFLVQVHVEDGVCGLLGWLPWRLVLFYNEREEYRPTALRGKNVYTVRQQDLREVR